MKLKNFEFKFKLTKAEAKDICFRLLIVFISSMFYSLAVAWFMEPAGLLSLGFTGVGQILNRIWPNFSIGLFTLLLNLPLCIVGFKFVSAKFVIYTLCSVVIMSIMLMGWIPCPIAMGDGITWVMASELTNGVYVVDGVKYFIFGIDPVGEKLFISIIGGIVAGIGVGLGLRFGVSSGGIDVIAQAVNLRTSKFSFGIASTILNVVIAIIGGGFQAKQWNITFYTIIFIILCNIVVDKIHTAYTFQRLDIITTKPIQLSKALLVDIQRGCTLARVEGAYSKEEKYDVIMVVSSYEVEKCKKCIQKIDPQAWITVSPVKKIFGAFNRHTII